MTLWHAIVATPLGDMLATTDGIALTVLDFDRPMPTLQHVAPPATGQAVLDDVRHWLDRYCDGVDEPFAHPLAPEGTSFQRDVWAALCTIRHGTTVSYADIARQIGRPTAMRAVGAANGRNPIAILVPCHRVIGANGTLTGYAGGIHRKQALIALEHRAGFALVA